VGVVITNDCTIAVKPVSCCRSSNGGFRNLMKVKVVHTSLDCSILAGKSQRVRWLHIANTNVKHHYYC